MAQVHILFQCFSRAVTKTRLISFVADPRKTSSNNYEDVEGEVLANDPAVVEYVNGE